MAIKKYLDWKGYFEGLYLSWVKTVTTSALAFLGTNGAEKIGLHGVGIDLKQLAGLAASITVWEVIKYLNAKPLPDTISYESSATDGVTTVKNTTTITTEQPK